MGRKKKFEKLLLLTILYVWVLLLHLIAVERSNLFGVYLFSNFYFGQNHIFFLNPLSFSHSFLSSPLVFVKLCEIRFKCLKFETVRCQHGANSRMVWTRLNSMLCLLQYTIDFVGCIGTVAVNFFVLSLETVLVSWKPSDKRKFYHVFLIILKLINLKFYIIN